ncbi:rhodanese-like domain-containing protein [Leptolyngbya iicbica]|uniref:rhodanese-like domain-containing protein n=1 Tax=Leptolyngbya iicbica TaxID=3161580 RepID=UPI0005C4BC8E|nr:rhodanese-like domain-containing protein [Leptolyngbya sp. LK]
MFGSLTPLRHFAWTVVKRLIRQKFPTVERISTAELASWLASDLPPPLLIDARQAEEYAVSHLPGAHHWPTLAAVQQAAVSADAAIVVYCSVGYRSARLAQQLQAAGYTHVMNLEGSIFEWHNQGQPLVVDGKPTQAVHPYNRTWGLLLASPE